MNKLLNYPQDSILAFDIETIPDVTGLRLVYQLPDDLPDTEVVQYAQQQRRSEVGHDFMPLYLHQVLAISCCFRRKGQLLVKSVGKSSDDEKSLLKQFFNIFQNYNPQLVSWNGNGFDLPVLQHRALIHGVAAPSYWDVGVLNPQSKWNNYLGRYHFKHCDLMDVLALYQGKNYAPLDNMAKLCGFPGKMGMDGSQVWQAFVEGKIESIRHYCETDAMNTYLIFLRFQLIRGLLDENEYDAEIGMLKNFLRSSQQSHFIEFLTHFSN